MKNLEHLMLDLETMGNRSNSAIVSIGAVEFDILTGEIGRTFYRRVDMKSCLDLGMIVTADTIEWWLLQNETARKKIVNDTGVHLAQMLADFTEFLNEIGGKDVCLWGNGARFDIGILEDAFTASKLREPWNFRLERDVRTLASLRPEIYTNFPIIGIEHNPIDDCIYQIKYCSAIWRDLNGIKYNF